MKQLLENWKKFIKEDKDDINQVAKVMILDDQGNFLSLLRTADSNYMPNAWDFPGGHLKDGETHEAAARRETREETGLSIDNLERIGEDDTKNPVVFFKTDSYSGTINLDTEENQQFKWIKLSEVDNYNTVPSVDQFVKQELKSRE